MKPAGSAPPPLRARPSTRRLLVLAVAAALVSATACSDGGDDAAAEPAAAIVTATAGDAEADAVEERPLEGRTVDRFALETGMCFNEYVITDAETGETSELTTRVDCRRPHDGEVYAEHIHPADATVPFPGSSELQRWGTRVCYDDFEGFVGELYELSRLEIGVIVPDEPAWTAGLYRTVACYVGAGDDELLSGSMRGAAL
ncbi:MAG: septum formation family protein [Acidimicrobiales bacterium]